MIHRSVKLYPIILLIVLSAQGMDKKKRPSSKRHSILPRLALTLRGTSHSGYQQQKEQPESEFTGGLAPIMTSPLWSADIHAEEAHAEQTTTRDPLEEFAAHMQNAGREITPPQRIVPARSGLQALVTAAKNSADGRAQSIHNQTRSSSAVQIVPTTPPPIPPHRYSPPQISLQTRVLQQQARDGERAYQDFQAATERTEPPTKSQLSLPPGSPPKNAGIEEPEDSNYTEVVESEDGSLAPLVPQHTQEIPPAPARTAPKLDPATLNHPDARGRTLLWIAVSHGKIDTAKELLQQGATPRIFKDGDSLIHEATLSKQCPAAMIDILAQERGVDLNQLSKRGLAPIHMAARGGALKKLSTLLSNPGLNVNLRTGTPSQQSKTTEKKTALHLLAARKPDHCRKMVQMLIEAGADIFIPDEMEKTALEIATDSGNHAIIPLLLHHTPIGHESVQKAYTFCKNPEIKKIFEERTDIVPQPTRRNSDGASPQQSSEDEQTHHKSSYYEPFLYTDDDDDDTTDELSESAYCNVSEWPDQ